MTEDDEFKLLEQRLAQKKERAMYRPLERNQSISLDEIYSQITDSEKYQIKTEDAKLSANDKQIGGMHYKKMGVEPWDVIDTWPLEQRIGYYRGNALKYIMRMGSKDQSDQEANKGLHYLEKLVEVLKE